MQTEGGEPLAEEGAQVLLQQLAAHLSQQGGRGDGDGLPSGGEHRPAVTATLRDPEGISLPQPSQDGQVVERATSSLREAKPGLASRERGIQVAPLHTHQRLIQIVVGDLQPGCALRISPARQSAPADDTGINPSLVMQEVGGLPADEGALKETRIPSGLERLSLWGQGGGRIGEGKDIVRVAQPAAGLHEGEPQHAHRQIDHPSVGIAHETAIAVLSQVEREGGLVIVVKRAEALVAVDRQAYSLCHPLDGEGA